MPAKAPWGDDLAQYIMTLKPGTTFTVDELVTWVRRWTRYGPDATTVGSWMSDRVRNLVNGREDGYGFTDGLLYVRPKTYKWDPGAPARSQRAGVQHAHNVRVVDPPNLTGSHHVVTPEPVNPDPEPPKFGPMNATLLEVLGVLESGDIVTRDEGGALAIYRKVH